jgi:hypothetical protein
MAATAVAAMVLLTACANKADDAGSAGAFGETERPRAEPEAVDPEVVESAATGSSALDALDADFDATFAGPRRDLADLIIPPTAVGGGLRLAALEVDDPNGTGHIDGRWYPPQVRNEDCSIKVDTPPIPTAAAVLVPGDPDELLSDDPFAGPRDLLEAPFTVGIQAQLFDEPSQRDGLAGAMVEFYETMGDLQCEQMGSAGEQVGESLVGEAESVPPYDTGFPGAAFEAESLLATSLVSQYAVGDRVLLTVTVSGNNGLSNEDDRTAPDPALAHVAIDAEIARLESKGLT